MHLTSDEYLSKYWFLINLSLLPGDVMFIVFCSQSTNARSENGISHCCNNKRQPLCTLRKSTFGKFLVYEILISQTCNTFGRVERKINKARISQSACTCLA